MPKTAIVRARVDPEVKRRAEIYLGDAGITISEAIRRMLENCVRAADEVNRRAEEIRRERGE